MARESPVFRWAADALERATNLSTMEARGTVRLALKKGGLDPKSVSRAEMRLVFDRLMPAMLTARAYDDADAICQSIIAALETAELEAPDATKPAAAAILKRLLGD